MYINIITLILLLLTFLKILFLVWAARTTWTCDFLSKKATGIFEVKYVSNEY